jgi:hypothetical protein
MPANTVPRPFVGGGLDGGDEDERLDPGGELVGHNVDR